MLAVLLFAAGGGVGGCSPERLQGVRDREFEGRLRPAPYAAALPAATHLELRLSAPCSRKGRIRVQLQRVGSGCSKPGPAHRKAVAIGRTGLAPDAICHLCCCDHHLGSGVPGRRDGQSEQRAPAAARETPRSGMTVARKSAGKTSKDKRAPVATTTLTRVDPGGSPRAQPPRTAARNP